LEGIFLDQYDSAALQVSDQSNMNIRDCVLDHIWWGILVENSTAICTDVSISNALSGGPTYTRGIITRSYAFMDIINCSVSNFNRGVELVNTVVETMKGCTVTGCDTGVTVSILANIQFREPSNLIQGNTVGINAQRNCVALEMGNGINWGTGNGTNVTSGTGASINF